MCHLKINDRSLEYDCKNKYHSSQGLSNFKDLGKIENLPEFNVIKLFNIPRVIKKIYD